MGRSFQSSAPAPVAQGSVRRVDAFMDTTSGIWRIANTPQWGMRYRGGGAFSGSDAFNSTPNTTTVDFLNGMRVAHINSVSGGGGGQLNYNNVIPLRGNAIPAQSLQLAEDMQYYEYAFTIGVPVGGYGDTADNGFVGIVCAPLRTGSGSWGSPGNAPANQTQTIQSPCFGITNVLGKWHWFVRQNFTNAGPELLDAFVDISSVMPPNGDMFRVAFRFYPAQTPGTTPKVQMWINGVEIVSTSMGTLVTGDLATQVGNCAVNENNQSADGVVCMPYVASATAESADLYLASMEVVTGVQDASTPTI